MNFQVLFTTERVIVALYRTVSTVILFYYLMRRVKDGQLRPARDRWRQ